MPAAVAITASALTGCGGAPTGDSAAIKSTVSVLFAALKHDNYAAACAAYTPGTQQLLERAAQQLHGPGRSDCPGALHAVEQASGPSSFAELGAPQFQSVTISSDKATVTLTAAAPAGRIAHSRFSMVREANGWRVGQASSLRFSDAG
jgi:hypothetical protein